jgi:hypothetical protein
MFVPLGVCLSVASLLLCSASIKPVIVPNNEPLTYHSVEQAFDHAMYFVSQNYNLTGLTNLAWKASVDNHPDLAYATHHVFINMPEMVGELQSQFALNPKHAKYMADQLTVYVHAPDDPHFSHEVMLFDGESHVVWSGKVDVDGHVTEYMDYQ